MHAHRLSHHSWLHNVAYLRELQPYPWLKINPATAQKYGIADGDWVRVESPHGWCRLKAQYFEAISPEVVMTKRGWWQACEELGLPGYGCGDGGSEVNNLYSSDTASSTSSSRRCPSRRWSRSAAGRRTSDAGRICLQP